MRPFEGCRSRSWISTCQHAGFRIAAMVCRIRFDTIVAISLPTALQRLRSCHARSHVSRHCLESHHEFFRRNPPVSSDEPRVRVRWFGSSFRRLGATRSSGRDPSLKFQARKANQESMQTATWCAANSNSAAHISARLAAALIIPNFDRALHTLAAHHICARLRD